MSLTHCMGCPGTWGQCRRRVRCSYPQRSQNQGGSYLWASSFPQPVWCPGCGLCPDRPSLRARGPSGSTNQQGSLRQGALVPQRKSGHLKNGRKSHYINRPYKCIYKYILFHSFSPLNLSADAYQALSWERSSVGISGWHHTGSPQNLWSSGVCSAKESCHSWDSL